MNEEQHESGDLSPDDGLSSIDKSVIKYALARLAIGAGLICIVLTTMYTCSSRCAYNKHGPYTNLQKTEAPHSPKTLDDTISEK